MPGQYRVRIMARMSTMIMCGSICHLAAHCKVRMDGSLRERAVHLIGRYGLVCSLFPTVKPVPSLSYGPFLVLPRKMRKGGTTSICSSVKLEFNGSRA